MRAWQKKLAVASVLMMCLVVRVRPHPGDAIANYKWTVPVRPLNCETNLQRLEDLKRMVLEQPNRNGLLIMLSRLGSGERDDGLSRRRLSNVRDGLTKTLGIDDRRIISAYGERVRGYGRVEFYLAGGLVGALPVRRNSPIIKCNF